MNAVSVVKVDSWVAIVTIGVAALWSVLGWVTWRRWRQGVNDRLDEIIDLQQEQAERGRGNGDSDQGGPQGLGRVGDDRSDHRNDGGDEEEDVGHGEVT